MMVRCGSVSLAIPAGLRVSTYSPTWPATTRGARQFEAIGMWAPDTKALDLSGLELLPMRGGLPRADYLKQLSVIDMVCLPLSSRAYDFIASGPVSDSIAALKPLIALRTRTLAAVWERYG